MFHTKDSWKFVLDKTATGVTTSRHEPETLPENHVLSTSAALATTDCVFTDRKTNLKRQCTVIMPKKENMTPTDEYNFAYMREIQISTFCRYNHDDCLVQQFCSQPY
jgi:hypothetical protein